MSDYYRIMTGDISCPTCAKKLLDDMFEPGFDSIFRINSNSWNAGITALYKTSYLSSDIMSFIDEFFAETCCDYRVVIIDDLGEVHTFIKHATLPEHLITPYKCSLLQRITRRLARIVHYNK